MMVDLSSTRQGRRAPRSGMTLIELLVVVGVMGVLAALAAPSLNEFIMRKRVDGIANEMMADFRLARVSTAQTNMPVIVVFNSNSSQSCYTIYTRETGSGACDCRRGVGAACTGDDASDVPTEIKTTTLPVASGLKLTPSGTTFRLNGITQMSSVDLFTVEVAPIASHGAGGSLRLEINRTGRPHICSLSGHTAYGACS
jgi:prepilin-type N-terminal cleavage/methylation domain-containing protein